MASYVVKVRYQHNLRRLTLAGDDLVFSYEQLQSRARDLFQLPSTAQVLLTYIDRDGDVVTMAEDQDLRDALVLQSLNPLRVSLAIVRGSPDVKIDSSIVQQQANSDAVAEQKTDDGEIAPNASILNSSAVDPASNVDLAGNSDTSSAVAAENELEKTTTITDDGVIAPASNSSEDATLTDETGAKESSKDVEDGTPTKEAEANESSASNSSEDATPTNVTGAKESSKDVEDGTPTKEAEANESSKEAAATDRNGPGSAGDVVEDGEREMHHGIQCDGCGMFPLVGSRFKSCKRPNYDLCLQCLESTGAKKDEYVHITYGPGRRYRLWHPAFTGRMPLRFRPAFAVRNLDQGLLSIRHNSAPMCCSTDVAPDAQNRVAATAAAAEKSERVDSSRVLHYGVHCDECGISPIEGPRFKSLTRFNYDLCLGCFEKGGSDARQYTRITQPIADVGYPLLMGRMMRLASPCYRQGPMCGRRVWVLNQIVPNETAVDQSAVEGKATAPGSHLNAAGDVVNQAAAEPAAESTSMATEMPVADTTPSDAKQEGTMEELKQDAKVEGITADQIPVFSTEVVDGGTTSNPKPERRVDTENLSTENRSVNIVDQSSAAVDVTEQAPEADLSTLEALLAKLGAMGFTDQTLNSEVLERNNFDLRKTLDDLCAAEEWDPILGELQEMGFYDANMNRRLMFKNNGSVKNVVKELVQLYKGEKQE